MNDHFYFFTNIEPAKMESGDSFPWQVWMGPNESRYAELGHLRIFPMHWDQTSCRERNVC